MKKIFLLLTLLSSLGMKAQIDTLDQRIVLIGDAGELLGNTQPVVSYVRKHVNLDDPKTTVIFLGDNIYPLGLPMKGEPTYEEAREILDAQINLVKGKKARSYFVLGNHDWKNGKLGGWQQALNQQNYINSLALENVTIQPTEGCPGPYPVELSDKVVAIFIDSQWFLYVHEKPGPGSTCVAKTIDEFSTELREVLAQYPNHLAMIVMHHPMYTFGSHGGDYGWKEHLFPLTALNKKLWIPLPVLGSIYPITRGVFGSLQDVRHPLYRNMVAVIEEAMKSHKHPLHVAGHEHNLQMIRKDNLPYIVSGSAINIGTIKENREGNLLFSDITTNGFVIVEVKKSGAVEAKFFNTKQSNIDTPLYTHRLDSVLSFPTVVSQDSIPNFPDSVVVVANERLRAGSVKRFFMGKNYRGEWTTPVKVPVLDFGSDYGGLTPEKQGGGKQTKSLRVEDKSGKEWALRSIQKFPEAAIPPDLRSPFTIEVVEDGISASYPFSSLSIEPLAKAAGVPTLRRRIVFIPDDPRLGRYRSTFKNTLATMEEREPPGVGKTYNTDELVLRLAKDNDDHVDQRQVLKARLLDNFYMDFDRHEGQWDWATRDTGKGKIYYPIPKDQDQAFYTNQGVIPFFARQSSLVPEIQGIKVKARNIKTFNKPARNFDRFFLNELTREQWSVQVDSFLRSMTDEVIDAAMARQPKEVRGFNAPKIGGILKTRRQYFKDEMMEYYDFISKEVNIIGSNQRELFNINRHSDGTVHVLVTKIDSMGRLGTRVYERTFDPAITEELRIYGLEANDSFVVTGPKAPILIRIVGGPGEDHFVNDGLAAKLKVYDVRFEENKFTGNFHQELSNDPRNNMYNRIYYKYNIIDPGASIAYNQDDGIFLGAKLRITTHGFRKEPYAMRHEINVGHALRTASVFFRYNGDIVKFIGNSDLNIRADVRAPINVTNFFGFGNQVKIGDLNQEEANFFRTRYNLINSSVLLRRQLQSWFRVLVGPTFQYFKLPEEPNLGKFVNNTSLNGLDPNTLYAPHPYLGAELVLDINSKNNQVLPTRGFVVEGGVKRLYGMNSKSSNITQLRWDMRLFLSLVPQSPYVLATRFGYIRNWGKFEFPQAAYLSGTDNLRGYRRDRFAGRTAFFNNTELRLRLGNFNTYLFPGSIGLIIFNDIGRVWADNDPPNKKWHMGYGGGLYIAPIQRFVIAAYVARSEEESLLPYVTFGFQF